ncbi:MAG: acyltransferase, partial [Thermomicrobia bacterium]|nr:acyltransferase [Thermomicrobia bacterium]MCA1723937.1 acyltransferase [Thermomicrobia bacterium]
VILFFVLSGFLLSQHWLHADFQGRPRPSARLYLRRRLLRIVPAYYACLFLTLLLLCPFLIPPARIYSGQGAFVLGAHLLFLQYIFPAANSGSFNIHGHLWTLTIEMIFYLVLPFVVVFFFRRRWMIALPLSALVSLIWLYLSKHALGPLVYLLETRSHLDETAARYFLSQQFPAHYVSFAFGIALANLAYQYQSGRLRHRLWRVLATRWMGIGYFFVGCLIVVYTMNAFAYPGPLPSYYSWELSVSIGFSLMIGGVIVGGRALQMPFGFLPLRFIGLVGYSAYLWHMPLIYLFNKFPTVAALPPASRFYHVLLYTTIALMLVSGFMFLAVEKPFLLRGRRQGAAREAATARPTVREEAMAHQVATTALPAVNMTDG